MAKYAIMGGYTTETWARFMQNPGDRTAPVRKVLESVGGKLETLYWTFGEDDFLGIAECPDDISAAAISIGVTSSGALRSLRTVKLITQDELFKALDKAKTVAAVFVPAGAKEPVGTRR